MKKIIFLSIFTFLYSQCNNLMKYPCMTNHECEWIENQEYRDCANLDKNQCSSGEYGYCYWSSNYNGESSCFGGKYSLNKGVCQESRNIIEEYVSEKIDNVLINIFIENGFELKKKDDRTYLLKENITLSYKNIATNFGGIEIIEPKFIHMENKRKISITLDSISLGLSMKDFISYIEQLIYNKEFPTISYMDIELKKLTFNEMHFYKNKKIENDYTIENLSANFNGYINQKILNDLDRSGNIPIDNQSLELNIKNFSLNKSYDRDFNFIIETLKELSLEDIAEKFFTLNSLNLKIDYLPEDNQMKMLLDIKHPFWGFNSSNSSKIQFNFENPDQSIWREGEINASAYLKLPNDIDLDLKKIPDLKNEAIALRNLPANIDLGLEIKYSRLNDFIEKVLNSKNERTMIANLLENKDNISFKLSGNLDKMGIDVISVKSHEEDLYISDAIRQIKTIYEESKIWEIDNGYFPDNVQEMIDSYYSNISQSTLSNWDFEINLQRNYRDRSNLEGTIIARSTEKMPGGAGYEIYYDVESGKFRNSRIKERSYTKLDINNMRSEFHIDKNTFKTMHTLNTNLFNANLASDIDVYSSENQWINYINLDVTNINPIIENYINIIEKEENVKLERIYNNINIKISGNAKDPDVKGIKKNND